MHLSQPHSLTKEKAISMTASVAVSLTALAAFAGIADFGAKPSKMGASLTVVSLSGAGAGDDPAKAQMAPEAPRAVASRPPVLPDMAWPEKPAEPRAMLPHRREAIAESASVTSEPEGAEARPSADRVREATHTPEQIPSDVRATAGDRSKRRSGENAGTSGGYKAVIWKHLQRFRRPNSVGAGSTLVRFSIDDSGGVLNVGVARSSGLARFDREALQMVRRAAPFPKPPRDVGRDFIFAIEGQ